MIPELEWQRYQSKLHDNETCLYIFAYVPFGFAPRYVGEAVRLLWRFRVHKRNFNRCKYTVLLPSFTHGAKSRTHRDFVSRWHQVGALPSNVFVPDTPGQTIDRADSVAHWEDLAPLVCPMPGSSRHDRWALETRVRMDLESYYGRLVPGQIINWKVNPMDPRSRSFLLGRDQIKRTSLAIPSSSIYRFQGGPPSGTADDFFASLGTGLLQP